MSIQTYKDLEVWKRSMELVKNAYLISGKFPKSEVYGLSSQVRRAAVSVPSNIAEGWGRSTTGLFIQSLRIARGSLMELETELIIAKELKYLPEEELIPINQLIIESGKMLNSLIHKLENK